MWPPGGRCPPEEEGPSYLRHPSFWLTRQNGITIRGERTALSERQIDHFLRSRDAAKICGRPASEHEVRIEITFVVSSTGSAQRVYATQLSHEVAVNDERIARDVLRISCAPQIGRVLRTPMGYLAWVFLRVADSRTPQIMPQIMSTM